MVSAAPFLTQIDPGPTPSPLLPARLVFRRPITVLVGPNGCGKSTILRTIAASLGLPLDGGSMNEAALPASYRPVLGPSARVGFRERPKKRSFFSGDNVVALGNLLHAREADPDFWGDPTAAYGGHLSKRSHGQGVMAMVRHALAADFVLFDEPETALSPPAQLGVSALLMEWAEDEGHQAIIATHSPLFMRIPRAEIVELTAEGPRRIERQESASWSLYARATSVNDAAWEQWLRGVLEGG